MAVESRLNQGVKNSSDMDSYFDMKGLNKEEQTLIADITYLLETFKYLASLTLDIPNSCNNSFKLFISFSFIYFTL